MEVFLSLLAAPAVFAGALIGVALAVLFHWLAPGGTDTVGAGAWLVGLCAAAGLLWQWASRKEPK